MAASRLTPAARGVEEAWLDWLSQHPVSVPDMIEAAVSKSLMAWLDEHGEEIVAAAVRHELAVWLGSHRDDLMAWIKEQDADKERTP